MKKWLWIALCLVSGAYASEPKQKRQTVEVPRSNLGAFQRVGKDLILRIAFESENEYAFSATCRELRWRVISRIQVNGPRKPLVMALPQDREQWCHWGEEGVLPHPLAQCVTELDLRQCIRPEEFYNIIHKDYPPFSPTGFTRIRRQRDHIGFSGTFQQRFFPQLKRLVLAGVQEGNVIQNQGWEIDLEPITLEICELASQHYLSPSMLSISWNLMDRIADGYLDYAHYSSNPSYFRDPKTTMDLLRWLLKRYPGKNSNSHFLDMAYEAMTIPQKLRIIEFLDDHYPGIFYYLDMCIWAKHMPNELWSREEDDIARYLNFIISLVPPVRHDLNLKQRQSLTQDETMARLRPGDSIARDRMVYALLKDHSLNLDILRMERLAQMMGREGFKKEIENLNISEHISVMVLNNLYALRYFDNRTQAEFEAFVGYMRQNNLRPNILALAQATEMTSDQYINKAMGWSY